MLQPLGSQCTQGLPKWAWAIGCLMSSHPSQQAVQGWQFLVLIVGMNQR